MPSGRPSTYTDELATEICTLLACGHTLTSICKREGMPCFQTIHYWRHNVDGFEEMYNRARAEQGHYFADEAIDIADEASADSVQKAKLQVDIRKWTAAKLRPQLYGERVVQQHEGGETPIQTVNINAEMPAEEAARLYRDLLGS